MAKKMTKLILVFFLLWPAFAQATTEVWNKTHRFGATNQIVFPDQVWETAAGGHAVYEPMLPTGLPDQLWYNYGWTSPGLAYVSSQDGGYTYPSANKIQVLGNGFGGISGPVWHARVQQKADGTFRATFNLNTNLPSPLWESHSADGKTGWSTPSVLLNADAIYQSFGGGYVVPYLGAWVRTFATGPSYDVFFAVGPTEDGPFYKAPPAPAIRPPGFANGFFSGGPPVIVNGVFHSWANGAVSGLNPSDLYHVCSTDLLHWQIANGGAPVLTKTEAWEGNDQVADATIIHVQRPSGGVLYDYNLMYYDNDINATQTASIAEAWMSGTLSSLGCP